MLQESPSFPAAFVLLLLDVANHAGVPAEVVLSNNDVTREALADPRARVALHAFIRLVERTRALIRDPALGITLGLQTRATLYGSVGFATLSAPTLRTALELAVRYCAIVTDAIALRFREDDRVAELVIEEPADLGPARDVVLFWFLVGIWQVGRSMTGRRGTARLDLTIPEPEYIARFQSLIPAARFGQSRNRLAFDASRLDDAYLLHDASALKVAVELCEKQKDAMGLRGTVAGLVRDLLTRSAGAFPSMEEMAVRLRLSPRTLKRRLADEGMSYRDLIDAERRERALLLLRSPESASSEVAGRLGYANVANFERAFRRWTDMTPAEYRRSLRRGPQ
jgi:AraC-like DNA-binding protein